MSFRWSSLRLFHVRLRTEQTQLLGAPEREAHRVVDVGRTAELHGRFEGRGDAGAVVVDPGTVRDAVQVGADHHDVLGRTGLRLGDDVASGARLGGGVEGEGDVTPGLLERGAVRLTHSARGYLAHVRIAESSAVHRPVLVVDDDHACGAALGRELLLGRERAHPAIDEDDRPGHVEAVVIGDLASRTLVLGGGHQAGGHPVRTGGRRIRQCTHLEVTVAGPERLRPDVEVVELELWGLDVEALVFQHLCDVVDAGVVAGGSGRAVAVVVLGDRLQLLQVPHHTALGDRGRESARIDRRRIGFARRRAPGQDHHTGHSDCEGSP